MAMTEAEQANLDRIQERLTHIRHLLNEQDIPNLNTPLLEWHAYLAALKAVTGNASIDMSFVASLLAKNYLQRNLSLPPFDIAAKAQGAAGLDIDMHTREGDRVVAEIKTTTPFGSTDLGAKQRSAFMKDFAKLRAANARYKFFFVTDARTFDLMRHKYRFQLAGVTVVHLPTDEAFTP